MAGKLLFIKKIVLKGFFKVFHLLNKNDIQIRIAICGYTISEEKTKTRNQKHHLELEGNAIPAGCNAEWCAT